MPSHPTSISLLQSLISKVVQIVMLVWVKMAESGDVDGNGEKSIAAMVDFDSRGTTATKQGLAVTENQVILAGTRRCQRLERCNSELVGISISNKRVHLSVAEEGEDDEESSTTDDVLLQLVND
ncbi:unnamed protein product [Cuscuta campestris]|uniref:FHA domain-containing protein n=1 Tax=Cuscuta campestris TaxID=132261 RepID=A0A484MF61_9ASTE|nr:unnamed protein product [Cuscuta campestris]